MPTNTHTQVSNLLSCVQIVTMQGSQEREDTVNHTPSNTMPTNTHTSLKLTGYVQIVTMQGSQEKEDSQPQSKQHHCPLKHSTPSFLLHSFV